MAEEILLTQEGYDNIKAELDELVAVRRKEVAARLKEAISYGDLSENSEYDAAKNEQAELEIHISELEDILGKAKIVQNTDDTDTVSIGKSVRIKCLDENDPFEDTFKIVGTSEADPMKKKISNNSPVGAALLGTSVGDKIEVKTQDGNIVNYEVLEIIE